MKVYLNIAQMLLSAVLIAVILLQVKGSGLGGIFGAETSVFRTKRGVEKTLFQFTIVLSVLFIIISLISVRVAS
ncbi:MAG: preprotein translocase subunit SecG [Chloroflexi bacterium]|nr:preprotein translocase subunit SecG [Chloroflexota bacterium]